MADTPNDALMLLVQRLSEMQLEQGKALREHTVTQHEISTQLAVLNARLEPLANLTAEIHDLQLKANDHDTRITHNTQRLSGLHTDVEGLKTSSSARSGWETVLGRAGLIVLSATLAVIGTLIVSSKAQALPPKRTYAPMKYEHPCWAVPAPDNKHQWLYL